MTEISLQLNRRQALLLTGGALVEASCDRPQAPVVPAVRPENWSTLPALTRIQRMEAGINPNIPNFDQNAELARAVAQHYCQATTCKVPSLGIEQNIHFVSHEELIREVERDANQVLTATQRTYYDQTLEITSFNQPQRIVYLSNDMLGRETSNISSAPTLAAKLKGLDPKVVLTKSVLFHAISHINQSTETVEIPPITISGENSVIKRMTGFDFYGSNEAGKEFLLTGMDEAMTEYTAKILGETTGIYLSSPTYVEGVDLVHRLNSVVGLDPLKFIEYFKGKQPGRELLDTWGSIKDVKSIVGAMVIMAIRINRPHVLSKSQTQQMIDNLLTK